MKQLEVTIKKNVVISDLVCTPNVIVLAKQRTTISPNGEVTTTVRYTEVCKVEKTDCLSIVQALLKFCCAEFLVCKEFDKNFAETKIQQRKLFNQFLSERTIYRTDSTGKIATAHISEIPLRQTGLNVKDSHALATCKPENRKAAIYQHAKAIIAQCKYRTTVIKKAEELDKAPAEPTEKDKDNGKEGSVAIKPAA